MWHVQAISMTCAVVLQGKGMNEGLNCGNEKVTRLIIQSLNGEYHDMRPGPESCCALTLHS